MAAPSSAIVHTDRGDYQVGDLVSVVAAPSLALPNAQSGNYTLTAADLGNAVEVTSASASVVTVPTEATATWQVGTVIEVGRFGTGTVTLAPAATVTLLAPGNLLGLRVQYSTACLRYRGTNVWSVSGDLA